VTPPDSPAPGALRSREDVGEMFDRIAARYDLMNRVMTGGRDIAWRDLTVRKALTGYSRGTAQVLDVATGTGDLAIALAEAGAGLVVGLDIAEQMLSGAAQKSETRDVPNVSWVVGDAMHMPFADATFDACTVSFGLRNMPNYQLALNEMARVLRPGGRFLCLELTPLRTPGISTAFDWYFENVVPFVGGVLTGDRDAYRYLPKSVAAFPPAPELAALMQNAGFVEVKWKRLGGGTVALHQGTRPR